MKPLIRTIAALLFAATATAAEVERLPERWLAAVEFRSLAVLDDRAATLAEPWGRVAPRIARLVDAVAGGATFAGRPWVLALSESADGAMAPLLYAPTDDFAGLCQKLDADLADELGVATVAGVDVALTEVGGWVRATLLDAPPGEDASNEPISIGATADVAIRTSQLGRHRLAETLATRRRAQLKVSDGRRLPRWASGAGLEAVTARLAAAAPFFRALADVRGVVTTRLNFDEESNALAFQTELPVANSPGPPSNAVTPKLAIDTPIATLQLNGPAPDELLELLFAAMECRPSEIDAGAYAQPQWDDFAQACRELLSECRSIHAALTLPGEGVPVAANQVVLFDYPRSPEDFADRLNLAVTRWNLLIAATKARTPLRVVMQPRDERQGWRLSIDLFDGMKLPRTRELEALFARYYGGDGKILFDFVPIAEGRWLMTMGDAFNRDALTNGPQQQDAPLVAGSLRIDRWFAWEAAVEQADRTAGKRSSARAAMADAPPAMLTVRPYSSTGATGLRVSASLPVATYQAAVGYIVDK